MKWTFTGFIQGSELAIQPKDLEKTFALFLERECIKGEIHIEEVKKTGLELSKDENKKEES
jgi:hypothetical protein